MNDKDKAVIKAVITIKDYCVRHGCDGCAIELFCKSKFSPGGPIPAGWDLDLLEEE
ncbi:hypothetical protein [Acidaminococcus intestini]|uniref:Uncharacterized protein n=1 Tax=Acidaminococcus intestini (strain RyC-MR95) TaxID=568816 RepID=G4Q9B3_ACIIR|nr:hypothetical protein [Acidaminococcus intestini]AEQ22615.1 hypothetical protein Acin_1393 [Acidaminococcus intestini RyC-MR95]